MRRLSSDEKKKRLKKRKIEEIFFGKFEKEEISDVQIYRAIT